MNLKDKIKNTPHTSGIYQYFDVNNRILYIGKAKNLNKRIRSYFNLSGEIPAPATNVSHRIALMVKQIATLQTIITKDEKDALILENSLIKQLKPKYNILLRDDKTYPYILVDKNAEFARLEIVRKITNDKNHLYFGPYSSGVKDIIESIYEICPLVQKKSCINGKKSCLFYQINRCYAPCEGKITKEKYSEILQNAINLLNNPSKLLAILEGKMLLFARNLQFEEANKIKQKMQKIKQNASVSSIDLAKLYNCDIFAIESNAYKSVLVKIFMRNGKVVFSDNFPINHGENELDLNALYTQILLNHYKNNPPYGLDSILLPIDLSDSEILCEFFRQNFGKNIRILHPKSGEKKQLVNLAKNNAKNILENSQSTGEIQLLESLKSLLNLQNLPHRIEVFDTSHLQGKNAVGAKVVYESGEWRKDSYRRYNLDGSDEYAQMSELLSRRASSFEEDSPPDLWLLDGGVAQINIAKEILHSSGANIDIVAIAKEKVNHRAYRSKGGARDILRTEGMEVRLDKGDLRLLFMQKLRDEAHRFAISFHRQKRQKSLYKSILTDKYAPAQLKKLLDFFGDFGALESADESEIKAVLRKK